MNHASLASHIPAVIHIDTSLKPSLYKRLVWGASSLFFMLLLSLLALLLAYKILLGLVALAALWFGQIYSSHLLAISSLKRSKSGKQALSTHDKFDFLTWQLQWVRGVVKVPWGSRQGVYQAALIDIVDMGCMVILQFRISEPLTSNLRVTLWQDQVDSETWRQFKILAR